MSIIVQRVKVNGELRTAWLLPEEKEAADGRREIRDVLDKRVKDEIEPAKTLVDHVMAE